MIKRMRFLFAFGFLALFCSYAFCVNNVSALSFTTDLIPTGVSYDTSNVYCTYDNNYTVSTGNHHFCYIPTSANVVRFKMIKSADSFQLTKGYYYSFRVFVRSTSFPTSSIFWYPFVDSANYHLVASDKVSEEYIIDPNYSGTCTRWTQTSNTYQCSYFVGDISTYENYYLTAYDVVVVANSDVSGPIGIGGNTPDTLMLFAGGEVMMSNITEYKLSALEENAEKEQEDRDNLEQQSSDTESGADDSQQEAESTGTTLLSAFTSFVGALTSASPSNCRLNMDLGNLDLGNVDLCSLSPPPEFQSIASILLILFCVPLSIATARKVINLFRSFQ